jgi:phospholipase C
MLAAAFLLVAVACSSGLPDWDPLPPTDLGSRPGRVDATSFPTRWPIKHVVFIIKENRTFDNLFGRFPGADGATSGMDQGTARPLTHALDRIPVDIVHCYECALQAWNEGRMDGFASVSSPADRYAYTQFRPKDLPAYWHWAKRFVLGDNFFASAQGPSFPNHLYTIAAQSGGAHDNPIQDLEQLRDRHRTTGLFKAWGCDSVEEAYVPVEDREGKEVKIPPCFDFLTEGDLLLRAGIPWAYYSATNTQNGYLWSAYDAVRHIRQDTQLWQSHVFPVDGLVQDIRDNRLPPVTWVTPRFELSEHPEYSFCWGQNWTTRIVNAIMSSPMWQDTAIFITWDDYGGFYDHVPPPQVDRFGFGVRVPLLLISPYAKAGYVDHTLGEFSSVLRFIEDNWGLSQLTHRDRDAANLSEAFDFSQEPRKPDPQPVRTDCPGAQFPDDPAPSVQG